MRGRFAWVSKAGGLERKIRSARRAHIEGWATILGTCAGSGKPHRSRDRFRAMTSGGDVFRHTIRQDPPAGPETGYGADYEARAGLPSGRAHRPLPGSGQMQPGTSGPQPDRASRSWQNSRAKRTYSNTMQVNCVRVRRRCGKPVYGRWPCKGTADAPPLHKCREYDLTCRAYVIIYARTR